ncbi:cyclopropane-fatty-acyl-phospholipid synthase [Escherichia coli]|uniref:Cyclopropane-fatty-acyl-phospholipid synthase n=1 Tax=Escherichia coli TaxID=562 RepID=A0A377CI04_ECOLX|nr:cyclopropane-fatty-acyl-phospholipid synthase [Escherichia coli]
MEDWHNFGADYDTTLMAWYERFLAAWPEIADNYSERFKRMFTYYLNACAGASAPVIFSSGSRVLTRLLKTAFESLAKGYSIAPLRGRFQIRLLYLVDSWHFLVPPAHVLPYLPLPELWINFNVDACAEFFLPKSRAFQSSGIKWTQKRVGVTSPTVRLIPSMPIILCTEYISSTDYPGL